MSDVVTIAEAAALLRCKPWDVYAKMLDGTLAAEPSCVCERGPWLIRRAELGAAARDIVTIAEAAALLDREPWDVHELVRCGDLAASRPLEGVGAWLVHRDALAGLPAAS
ncbi:hypothetical protein [Nocardioides okcheonensis]|uniref:hypothetical protein n=1 Tax=Nocardioides okcheonensis TaxID=2894081 RepID=UPI001E43C181|nr:hypothetical protein [Nocardioides okcheonensis]UFN44506.1 hypothetical protein LN652_21095 [Nocardioides okcheonensis]